MFAAIHNGLKIIAADIGNAYLHAKTTEKSFTLIDTEGGELSGKILIFDKGLYGLESSLFGRRPCFAISCIHLKGK
jgi:hypothetical protein